MKEHDKSAKFCVRLGKLHVKKEIEPEDGRNKCHQSHACLVTTLQNQFRAVKKILNHIKSSETMKGMRLEHFEASNVKQDAKRFCQLVQMQKSFQCLQAESFQSQECFVIK